MKSGIAFSGYWYGPKLLVQRVTVTGSPLSGLSFSYTQPFPLLAVSVFAYGFQWTARQITAHRIWVLRSGPDDQSLRAPIGNGAGWADRAVHLIGPDVAAIKTRRRAFECALDIALIG